MTLYEKLIEEDVKCDLCGEIMLPMHGSGWDNDRLICSGRYCQAEVVFPTSTYVKEQE